MNPRTLCGRSCCALRIPFDFGEAGNLEKSYTASYFSSVATKMLLLFFAILSTWSAAAKRAEEEPGGSAEAVVAPLVRGVLSTLAQREWGLPATTLCVLVLLGGDANNSTSNHMLARFFFL